MWHVAVYGLCPKNVCLGIIDLVLILGQVPQAQRSQATKGTSPPVPKARVVRTPPPFHLFRSATTVKASGITALICAIDKGSRGPELNNHLSSSLLEVSEGSRKRVRTTARRQPAASEPKNCAVGEGEVLEYREVHRLRM